MAHRQHEWSQHANNYGDYLFQLSHSNIKAKATISNMQINVDAMSL